MVRLRSRPPSDSRQYTVGGKLADLNRQLCEGDYTQFLLTITGYENSNGHAQMELTPRALIVLGHSTDFVGLKRKASGSLELDDQGISKMAAKRGSSSPSKSPNKSIW